MWTELWVGAHPVVDGMRRMVAEFVLLLGFAYRSLGEGRGVPIPLFIVEDIGSSGSL
jgi:hypothetical protein